MLNNKPMTLYLIGLIVEGVGVTVWSPKVASHSNERNNRQANLSVQLA